MPALVTNAGMFALTAQTSLPSGREVVNRAPGDAVGANVESTYRPQQASTYFAVQPESPKVTYVVFDEVEGAAVVVRRVM